MKTASYKIRRRWLLTAACLLVPAGTMVTYALTGMWSAALLTGGLLLALQLIALLQHRLDDRYISGVVNDLSRLCDSLLTLEAQAVFPENEDNMLSKLQNKVLKLVKTLQHRSNTAVAERENIKSLVSDMSHQLKTPIANLKMYTEFLEDPTLTAAQRQEYVEIVRLSVERLNFLSESMIKLSRLEGGLIHLHAETQSLNETVLMALKDVFAKAKQHSVELTYTGEEVALRHDKRWTAEAIFNLLDNAVKYSPAGSVIAITVKRLGMFAVVAVADMAAHIPEAEKNKVFARFYRGRNSRNTEGIGVGLYLAREIIVLQGGYMNLSAWDKGNVFAVFLPVEQ